MNACVPNKIFLTEKAGVETTNEAVNTQTTVHRKSVLSIIDINLQLTIASRFHYALWLAPHPGHQTVSLTIIISY